MKLDSILAYQDVDMRLFALEREVNGSKESKDVAMYREFMKEYSGGLIRVNAEMDEAVKLAHRQAEELCALEAKIDDMANISIEDADVEELDLYEKEIQKLAAEADAFKRAMDENEAQMKKILQNFDEKFKQCAVCKKKLDEANVAFKKLIDSKGEEVTSIKRRLAEIKKDIPEDVMELYLKRRSGKKMPAFVPLNIEDKGVKACRCGMKLLDNALAKLKTAGDTVECQGCGRIIFVK